MNSYATRVLPPTLGDRLQQTRGLARRPSTLGDLTRTLDLAGELSAETPTLDASTLCSTGPSRHELLIGGETRFTHCVLDALMLPIIEQASGVVRSTSPLSGTIVELRVDPNQAQANPPGAVVSFGMLRESSGTVYETTCPYINIFASLSEYERWVEASPEAITISMPVAEAFDFGRDLVKRRDPSDGHDAGPRVDAPAR